MSQTNTNSNTNENKLVLPMASALGMSNIIPHVFVVTDSSELLTLKHKYPIDLNKFLVYSQSRTCRPPPLLEMTPSKSDYKWCAMF